MNVKVLGENRKAYHLYFVEEKIECGLSLQGTEVKSLRGGKFSFNDAYVQPESLELFLLNFHITPFFKGTTTNHEPLRKRKLLAHKHEIEKLSKKVREKGYTLVPLQIHLSNGRIKVMVGLCKGKQLQDKRESLKEKDAKRDMDRADRLR